jgi:hypothetical protein
MTGFNNQTLARYSRETFTVSDWRDFVKNGRNKTSRKAANNTVVRIENETAIIRLHETDIVTIKQNGNAILNSGGWQTVTTKERINRYTSAGISQRNSIWYMRDGSLFYDGIEINANGYPIKPKMPEKHEREMVTIKKQAKQYAHAFVEKLQAGEIGLPSGGDCWGCYFALNNSKNDPQPMGVQHLYDHIKDQYFVPSLLVNAAHDAGYQDFQVGLMGIAGRKLFIDPEQNIYKYMVKYMAKGIK